MLISKCIFLFLVLNFNSFAVDKSAPGVFEKEVPSKMIKPNCEYHKGDETGVFSIEYSDNVTKHYFLVMKGIDPKTCKWHESEVKKIMKLSKIVTLKGRGENTHLENGKKVVTWMWTSVTSGEHCHSYFTNDCP